MTGHKTITKPEDQEQPRVKGLYETPCSLSDFMRVIQESPIEWVSANIHPYVSRRHNDTDAKYLRRMALWAMVTNTFPGDALLEIGDRVEIISNVMTKGKIATIVEFSNPKWEVSFSPQWCGWYLPHELRKVPCANAKGQPHLPTLTED